MEDTNLVQEIEPSLLIGKKEYDSLVADSEKLKALEEGGVDNWEGYSYAMELYYGKSEEDSTESTGS